MSAFVNLTLNTKVYTPTSYTGGIAQWVHRPTDGIATSYSTVTQSVKSTNGVQGAVHTQHKLTIPVIATTDSDCACAGTILRTAWVDIHSSSAPTSTLVERTELYDQLCDLILTDAFKDAFTKNEPVFSA